MNEHRSLAELRADFLATSTQSMPLAGLIVWSLLGLAALWLSPQTVGNLALYVMMGILPLAFLLERARGRTLFAGGSDNPLLALFLQSIFGIAVFVPIGVIGAAGSGNPTLIVLAMAILAGVIWIPYGFAAGDPVGLAPCDRARDRLLRRLCAGARTVPRERDLRGGGARLCLRARVHEKAGRAAVSRVASRTAGVWGRGAPSSRCSCGRRGRGRDATPRSSRATSRHR